MPRRAREGEVNAELFDRFTLVHFAAGGVAGAVGLPWWAIVIIGLGWELLEDPLKSLYPEVFPIATFDRKRNSFTDFLAFIGGASLLKGARSAERASRTTLTFSEMSSILADSFTFND